MHGTITADSEKGKGTAFTATVTLEESSRIVSERAGDSFDPSRLKALLVDGDGKACRQVCSVLAEAGVEAVAASTLPEALALIGRRQAGEPYGLVVVDWKSSGMDGMAQASMPEMDGLETTQAIRALPRADASKIPIVALSANAFSEDEAKSIQAGLDAHLAKPIDPVLLVQTLGNLLSRSSQQEDEGDDSANGSASAESARAPE